MTTKDSTSQALPGTVVATRIAGGVRIDLVKVVGGWTVNTWGNGTADLIHNWCGHYTTHTAAKNEAERARQAFRTFITAEAIEARCETLRREIAYHEGRKARRMCDHTALKAAGTELAALEDFATKRIAAAAQADRDLYATLTISRAA